MSHSKLSLLSMLAVSICLWACEEEGPAAENESVIAADIENETEITTSTSACRLRGLEIVRLEGKVRYFGIDILQTPPVPHQLEGIPDVHVWLAEYPFTKHLNILTDEEGYWRINIIKRKGTTLDLSFVYEKDHYPSEIETAVFPNGIPEEWARTLIKSNVHTIESEDIDDIAMQMPDEIFLYYAKTQLETGIGDLIGAPYAINNLAVATVGKSWASIFDPTLPHGDPGADVFVTPEAPSPLSGPIYFDETVTPNPTVQQTSVDGGVLFNNLLPGEYTMSAEKEGVEYSDVIFNVEEGIRLYISSPPHSIQGSNNSGPGEE